MIRGLYTSGWSMMANNKKMDVISNNLANVDTTGYKKDTVIFESFPSVLTKRINDTKSALNPNGIVGNMQLSSDVGEVFTYYTAGGNKSTGRSLDLAISGSSIDAEAGITAAAFFTVGVPDQNGDMGEYYTRNGSFMLNNSGELVNADGYPVLGDGGIITLTGNEFVVQQDGTVIQDGEIVDRLLIKEFTNPATLRKFGNNLVQTTEETVEQNFTGAIEQGFLEQSNVNIIREMVDMITVMRSYEANQKAIQAQDATLEKAVNEVGAVR